jgi:hypothetical protein
MIFTAHKPVTAEEERPQFYSCGEYTTIDLWGDCVCDGTSWQMYRRLNLGFTVIVGRCCGWVDKGLLTDSCLASDPRVDCGATFAKGSETTCACKGARVSPIDEDTMCCGWVRDGACQSTSTGINDFEVTEGVLNELNPLKIAGNEDSAQLSTPGGIVSRALNFFIFPIAGLILFIQLLLGGMQMLLGAANSKSVDEGKQKITAAIVGFIILFSAYWIAQLLELIFGIRILS